jgi:hypothetical protein
MGHRLTDLHRSTQVTHIANTLGLVVGLRLLNALPGCGLEHVWLAIALVNLLRILEFRFGVARADLRLVTQQPRWWRALLSTFRRWSGRKVAEGQPQQSVDEQVPDIATDYPDLMGI